MTKDVDVKPKSVIIWDETGDSPSYPGLITMYRLHQVRMEVRGRVRRVRVTVRAISYPALRQVPLALYRLAPSTACTGWAAGRQPSTFL